MIKLITPVDTNWLTTKLGLQAMGPSLTLLGVAELKQGQTGALTFCTAEETDFKGAAIIGLPSLRCGDSLHIASSHPRLDFIRAFNLLESEIGFQKSEAAPKIHPSVIIGQNVVIELDVEIDQGTQIYHNVVIRRGVRIGKNCVIKSGAILGEEGFGFERHPDGSLERMPHWGSVRIGNDVEIGSLVTICRGAMSDTVIEDGVKIDDHCHIAHHCHIGPHSILTAGVVLCGSVKIGTQCWIAPHATILNKKNIGDKAFVGLGTVVTQDVEAASTVFGNPAKKLLIPRFQNP